jgi:hypothetical protein
MLHDNSEPDLFNIISPLESNTELYLWAATFDGATKPQVTFCRAVCSDPATQWIPTYSKLWRG